MKTDAGQHHSALETRSAAQPHSALHPQVQKLLQQLPTEIDDPLKVSTDLRKAGWEASHISIALTQHRLRQQAQKKLNAEDAHHMVFTSAGLQQATKQCISKIHAKRFKDAKVAKVADLGCGIGAESRAFAQAGLEVIAVEIDPHTATYAAHNLSPYPQAQVITADATTLPLETLEADAFFADPARRQGGKRLHDPETWLPPLSTVMKWAQQLPGGVKVAPGIKYETLPQGTHTQFTSVNGEVAEACIWFGKLAQNPGRSAVVIRDEKTYHLTDPNNPDPQAIIPAPVGELGKYIYEPDGAIVRAGLLSALAKRFGLRLIDPKIAYLTADTDPATLPPSELEQLLAFTQAFQVIDTVGIHRKQIKTAIEQAGFTSVDILSRGIDIDPQSLRKQLKVGQNKKPADADSPGGGQGSRSRRGALLLMRTDQKRLAVLGVPITL